MPSENLKVLHVIARFNIGGTSRYLTHLLPELENFDFDTLLVVGSIQEGEVEDSNLTKLKFERIENLGRRISLTKDLRSYLTLRRIVNQYSPDLIHTHTFKAGLIGRLLFFRIPKVHTFHGHLLADPEFSKFERRVIVVIERVLAILNQRLIVTGQQVAIDLVANRIGRKDQYISIPGESQMTDILPRNVARKNLKLVGEFTILWLARVAPVKNPKLLIEVARLAPDLTFLMAGDGLELDSLRQIAPPNLKILGFVATREVLKAADVFLSTSLNEGIPYSILEAQSAGLPVVAVKAGALSETIFEGINGYLVEPNAEQIVAKLMALRTDRELLEKMSVAAKEVNSNQNRSGTLTSDHIKLYKRILN